MANLCDTCGDSEWDLLKKILGVERDNFDRLQQLIDVTATGGGGGGGGNVNLTGIVGVAPSTGCGVATAGTLRVAHATDCVVNTTNSNGAGAAAVNIQDGGNSITVDGTVAIGSSVTPGTAASNLGKAEDAPHTSGDVGVMSLAVRNDAGTALAADGDYIPITTDSSGNVRVTTGAVTPGTGTSNLGKAEDSPSASGDTGVLSLYVRNDTNATLTNTDLDYGAPTIDLAGNTRVVGNLAHDAVDAGNPVKVGAVAIAHGTNPTAVAAADRTNLYANRAGIPFMIGGHPNIITLEAAYTAAQTDTAIVTVGAGSKIVVTNIAALCDNANTVDVGVRIGFGAATTPTTTGVVLTHPGIASGSGFNRGDGSGIIGIGADGEDLRITSEVPTGGSLRVLVSYHTIES